MVFQITTERDILIGKKGRTINEDYEYQNLYGPLRRTLKRLD